MHRDILTFTTLPQWDSLQNLLIKRFIYYLLIILAITYTRSISCSLPPQVVEDLTHPPVQFGRSLSTFFHQPTLGSLWKINKVVLLIQRWSPDNIPDNQFTQHFTNRLLWISPLTNSFCFQLLCSNAFTCHGVFLRAISHHKQHL